VSRRFSLDTPNVQRDRFMRLKGDAKLRERGEGQPKAEKKKGAVSSGALSIVTPAPNRGKDYARS
jgi:hypothetical protein